MTVARRIVRLVCCGAAAVALMPRLATAADRELQLEAAGYTGVSLPEISFRPALGGYARFWWRQQQPLQLGLETGLALTMFPYGNADGETRIGERSGYNPSYLHNDVTVMPHVAFGGRLSLTPGTGLTAFLGPTFLWWSEMPAYYTFIPLPTATLALDAAFGADGRYGLRAALSYITFEFTEAKGLFAPSVAFLWR